MKRQWLILGIILAIIIASGLYFNWAYGRIYSIIGRAGLAVPTHEFSFRISNMAADLSSANPLIYVSLGDSLTAGVGAQKVEEYYAYEVAQRLMESARLPVIWKNRAVPGAKTGDILSGFIDVAARDKPDVVTVLIGVNDIHGHISAADFRNNYRDILSALRDKTDAKVYAVAIPFIGSDELLLFPYLQLFKYRTEKFNGIIAALAAEYGAEYVDLYGPSYQHLRQSSYYSADMFHPAATGYAEWADIIAAPVVSGRIQP